MTGIIYRAFDTSNGMSYIGQTRNGLLSRMQQHLRPSAKIKNRKFVNALHKCPSSFVWSILIECHINDLDSAEAYWISFLECILDGYNLAPVRKTAVWSPELSFIHSRKYLGRDPFTPEARRLSHLAKIGKIATKATIKKMSVSQSARRLKEKLEILRWEDDGGSPQPPFWSIIIKKKSTRGPGRPKREGVK